MTSTWKYGIYDTVRVSNVDHPRHNEVGVVICSSRLFDGTMDSYRVQFGSETGDVTTSVLFREWELAPNPPLDKLSAAIRAMWAESKDPNYKPRSFRETVREKVIDRLVATGRVTRVTPPSEAVAAPVAPSKPETPRYSPTDDGEALCRAYGFDPLTLFAIEVKAKVGDQTEITTHQHVRKAGNHDELQEVVAKHFRVYPHTTTEREEPTT